MYTMLRKSKPATGRKIVEPIIYAKGRAEFYSEWDTFTLAPKEKLTAAEFEWKQCAGTITLSGLETEVQNTGPEAIFNLLKTETKICQKTIKDEFGTAFFKTTSASAKEFGTLYDLIINTTGTVGTINATTYSWWASIAKDAAALYGNSSAPSWTDIVTKTNRDFLPTMMRDTWGAVTEDNDHPSIIVTTQLLYDAYETYLSDQKRYMGPADKGLADVGFQNLSFRGVPVVVDSHCPDGYMFMLNEEYLGFRHSKNRNFYFEGFQKPVNQDSRSAKILWAGNVTCSNRRYQGCLYNLPTAY